MFDLNESEISLPVCQKTCSDETLPPPPSPSLGGSLNEIEEANFEPPAPLQSKPRAEFQESEAGVQERDKILGTKKFRLNKVQYQELKDSKEFGGQHRYIQNQKHGNLSCQIHSN